VNCQHTSPASAMASKNHTGLSLVYSFKSSRCPSKKVVPSLFSSHDFSVSGKLQLFLLNGYTMNDNVLGVSRAL
jgi:hypothetical protein